MTEFKVGDKVKVKARKYEGHPSGSNYNLPRTEGVVVEAGSKYIKVQYFGFISPAVNPDCFELVETHLPLYSEEAAVKLLTERGYEVKAPPEPLKGRGVVYEYYRQKGVYHIINKDIFDAWPNPNSVCRIVAIVDWTEGQGLNTSK